MFFREDVRSRASDERRLRQAERFGRLPRRPVRGECVEKTLSFCRIVRTRLSPSTVRHAKDSSKFFFGATGSSCSPPNTSRLLVELLGERDREDYFCLSPRHMCNQDYKMTSRRCNKKLARQEEIG